MAHPLDAARGVSVCLLVGFVDGGGAAMEDGGTVAALAFLVPGHVGKDLVGLEVDDLRDDDTLLLNPVDLIDVLADFGDFILLVVGRCEGEAGRRRPSQHADFWIVDVELEAAVIAHRDGLALDMFEKGLFFLLGRCTSLLQSVPLQPAQPSARRSWHSCPLPSRC